MKNAIFHALSVCLLFFISIAGTQAQEMSGKSWVKSLVDNEKVLAYEWSLKPGQKTDTHTHAEHFIYVLEGGVIEVQFTDGKKEVFEFKAGENGYWPAEGPHFTTNTGNTAVKAVVVELKDYPYKAGKHNKKQVK